MKILKKLFFIAGVSLFVGQSDLLAMSHQAAQRVLAAAQAVVDADCIALVVAEEAYDRACIVVSFNPNDRAARYQVYATEVRVNMALANLKRSVAQLEASQQKLLFARLQIASKSRLPIQRLDS